MAKWFTFICHAAPDDAIQDVLPEALGCTKWYHYKRSGVEIEVGADEEADAGAFERVMRDIFAPDFQMINAA